MYKDGKNKKSNRKQKDLVKKKKEQRSQEAQKEAEQKAKEEAEKASQVEAMEIDDVDEDVDMKVFDEVIDMEVDDEVTDMEVDDESDSEHFASTTFAGDVLAANVKNPVKFLNATKCAKTTSVLDAVDVAKAAESAAKAANLKKFANHAKVAYAAKIANTVQITVNNSAADSSAGISGGAAKELLNMALDSEAQTDPGLVAETDNKWALKICPKVAGFQLEEGGRFSRLDKKLLRIAVDQASDPHWASSELKTTPILFKKFQEKPPDEKGVFGSRKISCRGLRPN